MNQLCLIVVTFLVCCIYLVTSAPNPTFGIGGIGVGLGYDYDYDGGLGDFGVSPAYRSYGYGYSGGGGGYPLYGHPYGRRYRYPHFYPPIAVLAGK